MSGYAPTKRGMALALGLLPPEASVPAAVSDPLVVSFAFGAVQRRLHVTRLDVRQHRQRFDVTSMHDAERQYIDGLERTHFVIEGFWDETCLAPFSAAEMNDAMDFSADTDYYRVSAKIYVTSYSILAPLDGLLSRGRIYAEAVGPVAYTPLSASAAPEPLPAVRRGMRTG